MILKQLSPTLWQGCKDGAAGLFSGEDYRKKGIVSVICPANNAVMQYPKDVRVLYFPIDDNTILAESIYNLVVAFYSNFNPCFVHCAGGTNRSAALAAAILIASGQEPQKVYEIIKPWHESMFMGLEAWVHSR